jgi:hypothetical protein
MRAFKVDDGRSVRDEGHGKAGLVATIDSVPDMAWSGLVMLWSGEADDKRCGVMKAPDVDARGCRWSWTCFHLRACSLHPSIESLVQAPDIRTRCIIRQLTWRLDAS